MPNNIELCYSKSNTYPVNPNNEQVFATFQQDNPHINGAFVSAGTPFIMRRGNTNGTNWRQERPELVCTLNQIQSLPQQAKRNIALMDDMFGGENLQALADFYQAELAPMLRNESIGAIGAASTALDARLSNFAKAANKLQEALEEVRIGAQAKYPKAQMMMLEQIARELGKDFNQKFQAEINKYIGRVKSKRGTVYSNADRGINKAKSGRSIKPIQFTSTVDFQNLRAFEMGANVLGKGLIVLDAGIRAGNVHVDYLAGANWQKRAALETVGFGMGTAAGLATGAAIVEAGLGIALLATPVGWVIIIGTAVTVGYVAAKGGDSIGQWVANEAYNIGEWLNSL